ncbi:hypothetical protein [Anaerococcus urinomassiliensis]|uniref:hypothetical protein n=1 Tax=Anaerococcus urinomassiliensis TaxID=1745712 RepID=UPI00093AEC17|nr:hypothetical protein [Anaerococcus urinomassiliensis]
MNGIIRVLKAEIKENSENLAGAIIGLMIGVGFLSIFLAKTVMAEEGISFPEFLKIIIVVMILFVVCVILAIGEAQSLGETFPLASKLGNKRSDIALGLILKDILILILSGILMYLVPKFLLSSVSDKILGAFGKIMSPSFIINFVLGISSISLISGSIAYIFKVEPIIGSTFGIIFAFALFLNGNIMNISFISNMYLVIALFLVGQILRFYIINKLDARF